MNEQQFKDHVYSCLGIIPVLSFTFDGFSFYVKVHSTKENVYKLHNYFLEMGKYTVIMCGGDLWSPQNYWLNVHGVNSDKYPSL